MDKKLVKTDFFLALSLMIKKTQKQLDKIKHVSKSQACPLFLLSRSAIRVTKDSTPKCRVLGATVRICFTSVEKNYNKKSVRSRCALDPRENISLFHMFLNFAEVAAACAKSWRRPLL